MQEQVTASETRLVGLRRQISGFEELGDEFRQISQAFMELNDSIAIAQDDLRRLQG